MSELGAEQDALLGDSDEDVRGDGMADDIAGDGMADEIANMLADLRNTGEAEDDADIDLALVG